MQQEYNLTTTLYVLLVPLLHWRRKGLETLKAFLGQSGMQLALIWAGFLSRDRKNDVVQLL